MTSSPDGLTPVVICPEAGPVPVKGLTRTNPSDVAGHVALGMDDGLSEWPLRSYIAKFEKLQDKQKDMEHKVENLQKDLKENAEDQKKQSQSVEEEKSKLEQLKAQYKKYA